MNVPVSRRQFRVPEAAPVPVPARVIASDEEALAAAAALAEDFSREAVLRDRERRLPRAEVERFSASGLWGITVPKAYGGAAVSNLTLARVAALISAADPSIGQIPQNHWATLARLALYGSAEQKAFFFARVLAGERLGNATAEPGDKRPGDHETRLSARNGGLRLDGRKVYATGALFAHWVPVSARDDDGQNVTVYLPRRAPGLEVIDDWSGFGQRTTASGQVTLMDVAVEPLWVFRNGYGQRPALDTCNAVSQLVHVAIDLGIAQAAVADTQAFLRGRSHPARGSGVARAVDDPIALRDLGEVLVEVHAAEALTERAALRIDHAAGTGHEADAAAALIATSEAKVLATRVALAASTKLLELAGTQATLAEHGLDRHWRNARVHTLHDGVRWKYHAIAQFHLNGLLCDPWTLGHPYRPAPT